MQRGSTIFQHLTVRLNVPLDDPATPDGKLWNSVLKSITQSQGWNQIHWGFQMASEENVDLLICKICSSMLRNLFHTHVHTAWKSHDDLQNFMTHAYQPFLAAIEPILPLRDGNSHSIPSPYIMQLHPGMPTLELGAVSSLYELSFESQLDADLRTGLTIETQLCRSFFSDAAQDVSDSDLFLGMDAVWIEQYEAAAPSSSSSTATGLKAEEGKRDEQKPKTLLIITEWMTQDAEDMVLGSGNIEESRNGRFLTNGDYFAKKVLQQASTYANHRVIFENISSSNVQWLDKEEKWSTYIKNLIDKEERGKSRDVV